MAYNCSKCGNPLVSGATGCERCGLNFQQPVPGPTIAPGWLPASSPGLSKEKPSKPAWKTGLVGCIAILFWPITLLYLCGKGAGNLGRLTHLSLKRLEDEENDRKHRENTGS